MQRTRDWRRHQWQRHHTKRLRIALLGRYNVTAIHKQDGGKLAYMFMFGGRRQMVFPLHQIMHWHRCRCEWCLPLYNRHARRADEYKKTLDIEGL